MFIVSKAIISFFSGSRRCVASRRIVFRKVVSAFYKYCAPNGARHCSSSGFAFKRKIAVDQRCMKRFDG
jgi:hypothetical protein